jgi:cytochrome c2
MSPRSRALLWLGIAGALVLASMAVATALLNQHESRRAVAIAMTGGDPAQGPALIRRYGCGGCHQISAVPGANGKVAPPLDGLRERVYLAGVVRNAPESLMQWIVSPHSLSPNTAMPETGITKDEARHVAAFLYMQR